MAPPEDTLPGGDAATAVRGLEDRIPLVKAHLVGAKDGPATSNAMPWTDIDQREQVFQGMGVVAPPYEPETLAILYENSSSLRQNVEAYVTNIDAFGHRFEPVLDLDADDADQKIANAIAVERAREGETADAKMPTPEEIAAKKRELAQLMRLERSRIEHFFEFCSADISFVTLRRRTRQDVEVMGNGYWEVLRDGGGDIVQFVYLPAFTMRLLPLDPEFVEVEMKVKVADVSCDTVTIKRRFRRYVQVFEQQVVYFKELGDPRIISRKRGLVFKSIEEMVEADPEDGPATEVLHFKLHNPRSAYGTPRWIGNLLSVLGTRQAEEVNFLYFSNKSVPPLALLVSGGRLSQSSIPRIESFIETHIKGKQNFHRILILEAESPSGSGAIEHTGRMKIELKPLTSAQQNDALFQNYDERNADKVGQSFRLPRLLRGDIRDFNRSCYSADTETLTENGWKLHHQIAADERIAVFDPERNELRFEVPSGKHVSFVCETLYHFHGRHTDVLVTGDHKMLVRCPDRGWQSEPALAVAERSRFEFLCAPPRDVAGKELASFVLPKCCRIERGHRHTPIFGDDWVEFLGYFVSDGGLLETDHPTAPYLVFLRQKKPLIHARIERCLAAIGWIYSRQEKPDGTTVFCISNRCLRAWLVKNCGGRSAERHMPWSYVTGLSFRQLNILYWAMMDGDGTCHADLTSGAYHSASPVLADQAQAALLRLGMRSQLRYEPGAGVYRVMHARRRTTRLTGPEHVTRVPYEGEVYCFSCPGAGFFVTRRNGKVAIQGNTADAALAYAESQVFQPEREEFDWTLSRRILSDMGIRFWRFRSNSPVTRDPTAMADILKGLVNANVLTPEEGRELAGDVFNRDFKKINAGWVKQPVSLTLAGMSPEREPSELASPPVSAVEATKRDGSAGDGDRAAGGRRAGQDGRPRSGTGGLDLVKEARRLIALRDALRRAEKGEATASFGEEKRRELEAEVIRVPAEEMRSWFEPEASDAV